MLDWVAEETGETRGISSLIDCIIANDFRLVPGDFPNVINW